MKNTLLILISILMVVFSILAMTSEGYDYAAEKLYYRAMKAYEKIAARPNTAMPKKLDYVERNLQMIISRYPKSNVVEDAHLSLAQFHLGNQSYTEALNVLYDIINTYDNTVLLCQAHFLRGTVFEEQGQWDKALREYTILRDKYKDTPLALGMPLYIADYYKEEEDYGQAQQAFGQAVQFYTKVEKEERGTARGYASANLLIRAYMELEQYEEAGREVENTIKNYPKLLPLMQQVPNIDRIFIKKLNNIDKAIELYRSMKLKTNDHEFLGLIDEKIKALEAQR